MINKSLEKIAQSKYFGPNGKNSPNLVTLISALYCNLGNWTGCRFDGAKNRVKSNDSVRRIYRLFSWMTWATACAEIRVTR
jgi:hypothetical protein